VRHAFGVTERGGRDPEDAIRRTGERVQAWAPSTTADSNGYVLGREVSDETTLAARSGARVGADDRLTISRRALPPGFVEVARATIPPNFLIGVVVTLVHTNGDVIRFGAYDGDNAARFLARFWDATVADQRCGNDSSAQVIRALGDTHVTVQGHVPPAVVREIADRLRRTNQAGFAAFRDQAESQPARALLNGCWDLADDLAIVEKRDGPVRWVVATPTRPGPTTYGCAAYSVNGRPDYPMTFGSTPGTGIVPPGTYGIEPMGGLNILRPDVGSVQVVGGTVPADTETVVVERGRGNTRDGVVSDARDASGRRFFGISFPPPPPDAPFTRALVVAYDAAGREVGRFEGP
jgi:hypothetical protein